MCGFKCVTFKQELFPPFKGAPSGNKKTDSMSMLFAADFYGEFDTLLRTFSDCLTQ